jgi:two-component system cell cycle response regulator DivK
VKKVAVVDDNPANRRLVRALLKGRYELVEYGTGREALEGMSRDGPELVLLDISLPDLDGTEILREIRRDPARSALPVVALTAHAITGDREKFLAAGFDEYVSKPIVDVTVLLDVVARFLGSAQEP